jgi:hypothetical protein
MVPAQWNVRIMKTIVLNQTMTVDVK